MRSVNRRSPSLSPTAFLKKYLRQPASKLTKHDVMSQPVHEDSSYIEDSFFVDDEEDIVYSESESWSSDENCDTGDVSGTPHVRFFFIAAEQILVFHGPPCNIFNVKVFRWSYFSFFGLLFACT